MLGVVASGGITPGTGPTLAERSRAGLGDDASDSSPAPADPVLDRRIRPVGRRHCWVCDLPDLAGRRFAGLVVCWRDGPDGWSGRTIYVVDDQGEDVVIEAWVPAEHLRPV